VIATQAANADDRGRRRRRAGELLAERDRTHPESDAPRRPQFEYPRSRWSWLVAILFLVALGVIFFTATLPNRGRGVLGPEPSRPAPPFAAPEVRGPLSGDANICARRPCATGAGRVPACAVRGRGIVNSCELWRDRAVVLAFVFDRGADCLSFVDRVQRAAVHVRGVRFAAIYFTRKSRAEARAVAAARRWRLPVALDSDGAVTNAYRVGVCPTTVLIDRGGRVRRSLFGAASEDTLVRAAESLVGRR